MRSFEDVHADRIVGTLTMFDRMIFKGHLSRLYAPGALRALLWELGYPLTDFARYATAATEELTVNAKRLAAEAGRPYLYLESATSRRRGRTRRTGLGRSRSGMRSPKGWCACCRRSSRAGRCRCGAIIAPAGWSRSAGNGNACTTTCI